MPVEVKRFGENDNDKWYELSNGTRIKCGDCWQQTGVEGTYVESVARKAVKELQKKHSGYRFRFVKVDIIQNTTIMK